MNTLTRTPASPAPSASDAEAAPTVLAFDVGGTDMKVGLLPGSIAPGAIDIRDLKRLPTPHSGQPGRGPATADAIVERIVELTREYQANHPDVPVAAVGVTVPGLVDEVAGTGIFSANLGWDNYPFTDKLTERLRLPVAFGHDVAMAGEAELQIGAARGHSDVVVMVIGTGIAGAVVCDGHRVRGGGYSGELGHAMVPTGDGSTAILESVGSARAIAQAYQKATGTEVDGARAVLELAQAGDEAAVKAWETGVQAVAFSIAQCVSILGTETVVLGGGLSMAGPALFEPLAARIDALLSFHRRPNLVHAELGENAGLIGSALKARALLAAS
ncbi:ROK family protein [Arthrobacter sp. 35W]|uniref:ROK family protein n=1 Tax=Arthrobacter sp. 35W TaxID=1132441 RepID=UPI0004026CB4|nr:ROK family protein [Arthrobacter sp. 35W]